MSQPDTADEIRYDTVVTHVGEMVPGFVEQGIVILFGDQAPAELHEISVLHKPTVTVGGLTAGDVIEIGGERFPVLAVGHVADQNLINLGHIDLKFNGEGTPQLPGDVCLPRATPQVPSPGSAFRVIAGPTAA
ncbi:PTS glucitol/sorbitol transporter subunit IIA [Nocardia amamiensis]|uniref:PTS glucitol/sorbitol transporter subunit IIA n=1 Tax=Nocardia amamiensis TaxID=404578 RepID=UPI000831148C|nr:PTS glucitol/sorbitol transporter subunit IIA [Nocardia amamiensis]